MNTIKSFLPVFNGYYCTLLGDKLDDLEAEIEYYKDELNKEVTVDNFTVDYEKAMNDLSKKVFNAVTCKLEELGVIKTAIFENLYIPREYNFYNDSINVTYKLTKKNIDRIKKYLKENNEEFKKYIKDKYTSCSGFISNHPNFIDCYEWSIDGIINNTHRLGAVLNFICEIEEINEEAIYYDIEFYIGEYMTLGE